MTITWRLKESINVNETMKTLNTKPSALKDERCTNMSIEREYHLEKYINISNSPDKTCINKSGASTDSKDVIRVTETCPPKNNNSSIRPFGFPFYSHSSDKRFKAPIEKNIDDSRVDAWNHTERVHIEVDASGSGDRIGRDSRLTGLKRNRRTTPSPRALDRRPKKIRRKRTWWLISADNHMKVLWDRLTALISLCSIVHTNHAIQTKSYDQSLFVMFCEFWFLVDICLNFVTEYKSIDGDIICDGKAVWARYLTTWFPIDVLSLIPWERQFVKPIVDMQKKRGFFKKSFFRTKAVLRVARKIRGKHFRLFGKVASNSKHAGVGGRKLLTYSIKYLPKYVLFYKNMKGVLAVRALRQFHWVEKVLKSLCVRRKHSKPREQFEEYAVEIEGTPQKVKPRSSKNSEMKSQSGRQILRFPVSHGYEFNRLASVIETQIESRHPEDEEDFGLGIY